MKQIFTPLLALCAIAASAQQPTISALSASTLAVGGSLTITGTNFNTTAANNLVHLGGAKTATPTAATATSLTVTIPNGATHDRVTVTNTASGLTGNSQYGFFPQFSGSGTTSFATQTTATVLGGAFYIEMGDLDGDGMNDIVTANSSYASGHAASVFRNTSSSGSISMGTRQDFTVTGSNGDFVSGVALGDIDGDGKLDMVITNWQGNSISVFRNTSTSGSISFAAVVSITSVPNPYNAAIADIDGDGKQDIIIPNDAPPNNKISVFRNTGSVGSISFAAAVQATVGTDPGDVIAADFDGDGKLDIACGNYGNNTASIVRNTSTSGTISFGTVTTLTSVPGAQGVVAGDIDGDGKPDLVTSNSGSSTATAFRNTSTSGTISFSGTTTIMTTTGGASDATLADVNGDGRLDVIVTAGTANKASVFPNTSSSGTISFGTRVEFSVGSSPWGITSGDLDNDGKPDLVTGNYAVTTISFLRNTTTTAITNTTWNGSTWSNGAPTSSLDAIIANTGLVSSFTCKDLTLNTTMNCTGTVTVNGDIINTSGSYNGGGTLVMAKSGTSTLSGSNFNMIGTVTVNSGCTFNTGGKLILFSSSGATGRIGNSAGTITGNVTMQRYIPAGKRALRLFAHPFTGTLTLNALTDNIDITGSGGSTNGFTTVSGNAESAYWFNIATADNTPSKSNPGWTPFTSATSSSGNNGWAQYQGISVLYRGTIGQGLGAAVTPSANTLDVSGAVNQGDQVVTCTKGAGSTLVLIGNPYPSNIDLNLSTRGSNIGSSFYTWDAYSGTKGAYVTNAFSSSYILASFMGFFVTTSANTNNTITFHESDKTTSSPSASLFKTSGNPDELQNGVVLKLYSDNETIKWDELKLYFDNRGAADSEWYDAWKFYNPDASMYSFAKNGTQLAIDVRPYTDNEVIPMGLVYAKPNTYTLRTEELDMPAGTKLFLHDKYLNTTVELKAGDKYQFDVTADVLSQGDSRFELNTQGTPTTITTNASNTAIHLIPNPATDNVTISYNGLQEGTISVTIRNMVGVKVAETQQASNTTGNVQMSLQNIANGVYMVTVQNGNQTFTQRLVKQ